MKLSVISRLPAVALALAAAALPAAAAQAQQASQLPVIDNGHALLTVSAEGRTTRTPELAVFTAGVTSQATTASAALTENSRAMNAVVAALKSAGIAARDIQTSNLSLNPIYAPPKRLPDGSFEDGGQRITGYQVTNSVSVKQRKLNEYGRVIDTLVSAGANQVNGPSFQIEQPDVALDEARTAAVVKARQRAELYARAAGLRVLRIVSMSEGGGYTPPRPVMYRMAADQAASAPAPPVESGELELEANVTIQFELAP